MSSRSNEELVSQFVSVTSSSDSIAQQYLARNQNDLLKAIEDYYATNVTKPGANHSAKKSNRSKPSGGIRTFRDLDRDEDDEEDSTNNNFFTGGEKSGLEVEDPNNSDRNNNKLFVDQIFKKAREQMMEEQNEPSEDRPKEISFTGTGFKLGGDGTPSEVIENDAGMFPKKPEKAAREITFWKQGFTVGNGPLYRYDDPQNERVLSDLNAGRVPASILNVEFGQDVDVSVFRRTDEEWVAPKRKIGGYHGAGHRLGSPVPGETIGESPEPAKKPKSSISDDEGQGDSTIQIRFANGKRVSHKFNSTDSITKIYDFVRHHSFSTPNRNFMLSLSFPIKPIEDSEELTVAALGLKNSVLVQKWT